MDVIRGVRDRACVFMCMNEELRLNERNQL